jgi:hypothetical protein
MKNQTNSIWNEKYIEILRQEWRKGTPCRQIAEVLGHGFTKNSVIGKARRLQLPIRKEAGLRSVL